MDNLELAIKKIQEETAKNLENTYFCAVSEFLIDHLQAVPADAEKVLAEGKNIAGCLAALQEAARKVAVKSVAVLTDTEAFELVLKYYDCEKTAVVKPVNQHQQTSNAFDLSLDDLLG